MTTIQAILVGVIAGASIASVTAIHTRKVQGRPEECKDKYTMAQAVVDRQLGPLEYMVCPNLMED